MLTTQPFGPYEAPAMAEPLFTPEEQKKFDAEIAEILSHYPADRKSAGMLPALRLLQELSVSGLGDPRLVGPEAQQPAVDPAVIAALLAPVMPRRRSTKPPPQQPPPYS